MSEYIERNAVIALIEERQKALCPLGRYSRSAVYGSDRDAFDAWQELIDAISAIPTIDLDTTSPHIVSATFCSMWDGGVIVETPCMVNLKTKEVFNIEAIQNCDGLNMLEKEYIEIDGVEYPVFQTSDITEKDNEYWYE